VLATLGLAVFAVVLQIILFAVAYIGVVTVDRPADLDQTPDLPAYVEVGLGLASIAVAALDG
jgi:hypothetical protein